MEHSISIEMAPTVLLIAQLNSYLTLALVLQTQSFQMDTTPFRPLLYLRSGSNRKLLTCYHLKMILLEN